MNYFKIFIILYVSTIIWNLENLELSNEINQDWIHSLHKKWNFPLKISSINVIKSAVFCGFGHIYLRNP